MSTPRAMPRPMWTLTPSLAGRQHCWKPAPCPCGLRRASGKVHIARDAPTVDASSFSALPWVYKTAAAAHKRRADVPVQDRPRAPSRCCRSRRRALREVSAARGRRAEHRQAFRREQRGRADRSRVATAPPAAAAHDAQTGLGDRADQSRAGREGCGGSGRRCVGDERWVRGFQASAGSVLSLCSSGFASTTRSTNKCVGGTRCMALIGRQLGPLDGDASC